MCDGAKGTVSLFDGAYNATFDGDVFDSDYTRVEGISTGDFVVTVKQGQPIWPEWISENEAQDIDGKRYQLVDGQWVELKEEPETQANQANHDAA